MTTDKPEPMMSVEEAILCVLTGLGPERREVAAVIRSLDERARRAEAQASDSATLNRAWKAKVGILEERCANLTSKSDALAAQVKQQAEEIARLKASCTCHSYIGQDFMWHTVCNPGCPKHAWLTKSEMEDGSDD